MKKRLAGERFKELTSVLTSYLESGYDVVIPNLGRFYLTVPKGLQGGLSPHAGEPYTKKVVRFKPSYHLKERINNNEED